MESTYAGNSSRTDADFVAPGADATVYLPLGGLHTSGCAQIFLADAARALYSGTRSCLRLPVAGRGPRIQENVDVHEQLWEQLIGLGREETAWRAGCRYVPASDSWAVLLLNSEYHVDPARRTIQAVGTDSGVRPAGYLEQLCLLAYLIGARDLPLTGKLISVEKLDAGGFFFRGSHRLPTEKLTGVFGPDPQLLHKVGRPFNAMLRPFGDAAIELCVLPRIPLTLIIWAADEEFPARTSILFDQSATSHLPLDALFAAATLAINFIVSAAETGT